MTGQRYRNVARRNWRMETLCMDCLLDKTVGRLAFYRSFFFLLLLLEISFSFAKPAFSLFRHLNGNYCSLGRLFFRLFRNFRLKCEALLKFRPSIWNVRGKVPHAFSLFIFFFKWSREISIFCDGTQQRTCVYQLK